MKRWSLQNIPSLQGKCAVVTGGTSGIGFETVKALVQAGARVIFTGRYPETGRSTVSRIKEFCPDADVIYMRLDTSNLSFVREFVERITEHFQHLDILVNSAGLTRPQLRQVSLDGYEMQFAANYLGHFALTGQLLFLLRKVPDARVIHVASIAHKLGRIDFEDLQAEKRYVPIVAYRQSKLAMLIFGKELQRRFECHGWTQKSIPAHPGLARTNIFNIAFEKRPVLSWCANLGVRLVGQSAGMGALSILYAATAQEAEGGTYYGPKGFMDLKGYPAEARVEPHAELNETAEKLWKVSEELTGIVYSFEE